MLLCCMSILLAHYKRAWTVLLQRRMQIDKSSHQVFNFIVEHLWHHMRTFPYILVYCLCLQTILQSVLCGMTNLCGGYCCFLVHLNQVKNGSYKLKTTVSKSRSFSHFIIKRSLIDSTLLYMVKYVVCSLSVLCNTLFQQSQDNCIKARNLSKHLLLLSYFSQLFHNSKVWNL